MATFREALVGELREIIAGVFPDAKVYWLGAMSSNYPDQFVVASVISADHQRHFGGGSGMSETVVQIDCYAKNPDDAFGLVDAIRQRLDNRKGNIGTASGGFVRAHGMFAGGDREAIEGPSDASEEPWIRYGVDFTFWHPESVTPVP